MNESCEGNEANDYPLSFCVPVAWVAEAEGYFGKVSLPGPKHNRTAIIRYALRLGLDQLKATVKAAERDAHPLLCIKAKEE